MKAISTEKAPAAIDPRLPYGGSNALFHSQEKMTYDKSMITPLPAI